MSLTDAVEKVAVLLSVSALDCIGVAIMSRFWLWWSLDRSCGSQVAVAN
jgi:hypothetical protein